MTDPRDDVASAWLDGELDEAERAAIAGDPVADEAVAQARRELAVARAALAVPVPVPEGLADAHIARAVELAAPVAAADLGADVIALTARRGARRPSLVARAAAAVVVLGGLGLGVAAVLDGPATRDDVALPASSGERIQRAADTAGGAGSGSGGLGAAGSAELGTDDGAAALAAPEADGGADVPPSVEAAGAPPGALSRSASELAAGAPLDATGLVAALVRLYGPVATWPLEPAPPDTCRPALEATGTGAPVAVVPVERDGASLELVVPTDGDPYFVRRGSCDREG